jgi:hypothetical protein
MDAAAKLLAAVGEARYRVPVYNVDADGKLTAEKVGVMRKIELIIKDAASGSMKEAKGLDIPVEIRYDVSLQVPAEDPTTLQRIHSKGV